MSESSAGAETIRITADTSIADPDTCKFTVDRVVHHGGPLSYRRTDATDDAPLVRELFAVGDVVHVLIAESTITITKSPSESWDAVRRPIGAVIRARLLSSGAMIDGPRRTARSDRQVRDAIDELLQRSVNPSIAAHGGAITVVDFVGGVLSIAMSGGCQGCASSTATLRDGFERMARLVAPEVTSIVDTTDHAAGTAPFHQSRQSRQSRQSGQSGSIGPSPLAATRSTHSAG